MEIDRAGFEAALAEQRRRARLDRKQKMEGLAAAGDTGPELGSTRFVGYETLACRARVQAIRSGAAWVEAAGAGAEVAVVLDVTPFYGEGGGQVGDAGVLEGDDVIVRVADTRRLDGAFLHLGVVEEGLLRQGQEVEARVDAERRLATARNHSATHLLHKALKMVLGEHVNQAGSLVAPDRLRFDFTHFGPLSAAELRRVEELVNARVLAGLAVETFETSLEEARRMGAMALFGEKYGERVRVVRMGEFSIELCGGTHLDNTSRVGLFKIVSQESVGAGVRRVEAVTGTGALEYVWRREEALERAAAGLRASPEGLPAAVEEMAARLRAREKEVAALQLRLAEERGEALLASARDLNGVRVVAGEVPVTDMNALRQLGDRLRDRLGSGVVILGARANGKEAGLLFVTMVTKDLVARGLHAGRIVSEVARVAGGGGGGRPDMAQAGGKDPTRLAEALEAGVSAVRAQAV